MNPLDINEAHTNKLEWKKARKLWKDLFPYIKNYDPVGAKPEEVKPIYKLNKIKENLEQSLAKKDEIKNYSQILLMFINLILHIIQVRHDNIIDRICKIAVYKDKREQIIKLNKEIDEERQKIIDEAKTKNPNVKVPGENENKEEEKKEEEEKKKVKKRKKKIRKVKIKIIKKSLRKKKKKKKRKRKIKKKRKKKKKRKRKKKKKKKRIKNLQKKVNKVKIKKENKKRKKIIKMNWTLPNWLKIYKSLMKNTLSKKCHLILNMILIMIMILNKQKEIW
jgi:hypothetical protein